MQLETVGDWADDAMQHLEDVAAGRIPPGITTGIEDLTALTGGWKPSQLIIAAAKPAAGKTSLALTFARAAASEGYRTAFFASESPRETLALRLLSAVGEIRLDKLTTGGQLTKEDLTQATAARKVISSWPLHIDQALTLEKIQADVQQLVQQPDGVKLVVVDGLYRLVTASRRGEWEQELGEITHRLKDLAMMLDITVVATVPMNYPNRLPALDDLYEPLAQTADVVILLHRDDYYDKESPRAGEADLIVAKHRNGPIDTVTVAAQLHYARFVDMAFLPD